MLIIKINGSKMKKLIIFLSILILTGCSSTYGKYSWFSGDGYEEVRLGDGIYNLTYRGNGFTSNQQVLSLWNRRAKELCKGKPYTAKLKEGFDGKTNVRFSVAYTYPKIIGRLNCE